MKKMLYSLALLLALTSIDHTWAAENSAGVTRVYMPDGQFKNHLVRVYTDSDIGKVDKSQITLLLHSKDTKPSSIHIASPNAPAIPLSDNSIHPVSIDHNHTWLMQSSNGPVTKTGSMLLFNLSNFDIPGIQTAIRVLPELNWCNNKNELKENCWAIAEHEVNLSRSKVTYAWASFIIVALLLLIAIMSRLSGKRIICLLCEVEGKLSLSRTQMALWTVAIGWVVLAFGLARFEVPNIPGELLALMGASLFTTAVVGFQRPPAKTTEPAETTKTKPHWYDLLGDGSTNTISLARAQMVFWTLITLGLFVGKSILDGSLWQIPVELVALMGMSQAAYLAPKLNKPSQ